MNKIQNVWCTFIWQPSFVTFCPSCGWSAEWAQERVVVRWISDPIHFLVVLSIPVPYSARDQDLRKMCGCCCSGRWDTQPQVAVLPYSLFFVQFEMQYNSDVCPWHLASSSAAWLTALPVSGTSHLQHRYVKCEFRHLSVESLALVCFSFQIYWYNYYNCHHSGNYVYHLS